VFSDTLNYFQRQAYENSSTWKSPLFAHGNVYYPPLEIVWHYPWPVKQTKYYILLEVHGNTSPHTYENNKAWPMTCQIDQVLYFNESSWKYLVVLPLDISEKLEDILFSWAAFGNILINMFILFYIEASWKY
jgi:hypothetical protein